MTTETAYTTSMVTADDTAFIRNVLKANALFSALSGLLCVLASTQVAAFLGIGEPTVITVLGVLLLIFAADLSFLATRRHISPKFVRAVMVADILWVVGSAVLLLTGWVPFSVGGKWIVGLAAVVVAVFAELEYIGLKRMD